MTYDELLAHQRLPILDVQAEAFEATMHYCGRPGFTTARPAHVTEGDFVALAVHGHAPTCHNGTPGLRPFTYTYLGRVAEVHADGSADIVLVPAGQWSTR